MKNVSFPKIIGIILSVAGLSTMIGWFLNIPILKSIHPFWISMKFTTALCFFLSGIVLYFTSKIEEGDRELAAIILPIANLPIFLLMGGFILSSVLGIDMGLEELFVKELGNPNLPYTPGKPSLITMINFILTAITGVTAGFSFPLKKTLQFLFGSFMIFIGTLDVAGYLLKQPILYFDLPGVSSPISINAAVLFILLGSGLLSIHKEQPTS